MLAPSNNNIFERICSLDNLFSAWKKIEREFSFHDVWYDEVMFKRFKFNLRKELVRIQQELQDGTYKLEEIIPIPFPKKGCNKIRQAFRISVRDQVVWVAVCNILGPLAETKMPAWSFGNRLYVPMWKVRKQDQGSKNKVTEVIEEPKYVWKNGKFINSAFRLYMPWNRSWPRFRHLLTATLKKMAFVPLEVSEEEYVSTNSEVDEWLRLRYLNKRYFEDVEIAEQIPNQNKDASDKKPNPNKHKIFWASIDIERFYPHIKMPQLVDKLMHHCDLSRVNDQTGEVLYDEKMHRLLTSLSSFQIKDDNSLTKKELNLMGLDKDELENFKGLPTGLLVGGWLANIYLLDTDLKIGDKLEKDKGIAHFRYVDDHTFVSLSPKKLVKWVREYRDELDSLGLYINKDKFTPDPFVTKYKDNRDSEQRKGGKAEEISLANIVLSEEWPEEFLDNDKATYHEEWEEYEYYIREVQKKCEIDPRFPVPLMTQTLEKISQIGSLDLALLSRHETKMVEHDLKTLIVADLPEEEIKEDTRVSFASTFLSRILISSSMDYHKLKALRAAWIKKCEELKECLLFRFTLPQIEVNKEDDKKIPGKINENIDKLISYVFDMPCCGIKEWKVNKFAYKYPDNYIISDKEKKIHEEANNIADALNLLYSDSTDKIEKETRRVFYLLLKAANKVPDKLKIWIRLTEFCISHLPSKIPEILKHIKAHININLHSKECDFIRSQIFSVIANRLVRLSWDTYLQSSSTSHVDLRIQEILNALSQLTEIKDYASDHNATSRKSSEFLLNIATNFANYTKIKVKENELKYRPISSDPEQKIFEVMWIIDGIPFKDQKTFNILSFCDLWNFEEWLTTSLGNQLLTKIVTSKADYTEKDRQCIEEILRRYPEANLKRLWKNRTEIRKEASPEEFVNGVSLKELIQNYNKLEGNEISLKYNDSINISSEIVCLKIILSAIKHYNELPADKSLPERCITIDNTFVKREDLNKLWNSNSPSTEDVEINFNFDGDEIADGLSQIIENKNAIVLYRFGVMLYQLLSKDTDISWLQFRPEYLFEWPTLIRKLHTDGRIGSFCERLLSGCLLPTTRELLDLGVTTDKIADANFFYAPIFISNISKMADMIGEYFKTLQEGVTRISGNQRVELKFYDLE